MCGAGVWSAIKRFGCTLERPLSRTIWPFSAGPWLHAVNQRGGEFVIRIFDSPSAPTSRSLSGERIPDGTRWYRVDDFADRISPLQQLVTMIAVRSQYQLR